MNVVVTHLYVDQPAPPTWLTAIRQMFRDEYGTYDYEAELGGVGHDRYVALRDERPVGYAALHGLRRHAVLKSLLVAREARGRGISSLLERARMDTARERGLSPYVSCLGHSPASQLLKVKHGLVPVAVRRGYRVSSSGRRTSSVVFSDSPVGPMASVPPVALVAPVGRAAPDDGEPPASRVLVNERLRRVRFIGLETWRRQATTIGDRARHWYVDVIAPGRDDLDAVPDGLVRAGTDLDVRTETWSALFQVPNAAYWAAPQPQVIEPTTSSVGRAAR